MSGVVEDDDQPQPCDRCGEWLPAGLLVAVGDDAVCRRCADEEEKK